jgi:osmotically-inducible protein OsmY
MRDRTDRYDYDDYDGYGDRDDRYDMMVHQGQGRYHMADRFADRPVRAEQFRHTRLMEIPVPMGPRGDYGGGEGLWERVKGVFVGRGPKGYRRSDERVREDVCDLMVQHPELDPSDIEVTVKDGEVTLEGTVSGRDAKRLAEDLADRVAGVHDVHNRLRLRGGSPELGVEAPRAASFTDDVRFQGRH